MPEHRHPDIGEQKGKEETFRCRYGKLFLYVEGEAAENISAILPARKESVFAVWHKIILNAGDQYTLRPGILHRF